MVKGGSTYSCHKMACMNRMIFAHIHNLVRNSWVRSRISVHIHNWEQSRIFVRIRSLDKMACSHKPVVCNHKRVVYNRMMGPCRCHKKVCCRNHTLAFGIHLLINVTN